MVGRLRELAARSGRLVEFKTRTAREAEKLSPESIDRLQGVWGRERFIRRVGSGGSQNADLVLHPVHGVVVRKSARDGIVNREVVAKAAKRMQAAQQQLGASGFAKVHQVDPDGISFHEYVPGKTAARTKTIKWVTGEIDRVNHPAGTRAARGRSPEQVYSPSPRDIARHEAVLKKNPDWGQYGYSVRNARGDRLQKIREWAVDKELKKTAGQSKIADHLKKQGYFVGDLTGRNKVGNKFVDYEIFHGSDDFITRSNDAKAREAFTNRAKLAESSPPSIQDRLRDFKKRKPAAPLEPASMAEISVAKANGLPRAADVSRKPSVPKRIPRGRLLIAGGAAAGLAGAGYLMARRKAVSAE